MTGMEKETYLADPCGASSLPFWKTNSVTVPKAILILREDDPRLVELSHTHADTPYFKLIHPMQRIARPALPVGYCFITPNEKVLSEHIEACYPSERASASELASYRLHPTYAPDLWLAIQDMETNAVIASGIAELDTDIREGILEWVQVSPVYRRQGFGRIIVCELLSRLHGRTDFVTVSGKENDPSSPRSLYENCGFESGVIWHVLKKE